MDAVALVDSLSDDPIMPLTARTAPSPFNKLTADVVLRSLDGVEFLVRSHILIEASPWFETQLLPTTSPQTHVAIEASSPTLETLLRICYPVPKPRLDHTIEDIETALRVAMQYQLELPITVLEDELVDMARRGFALEVWALACRMKREAVGRRAVECTFDDDKFDAGHIGSMQGVCAGDYFRFREYRRLRGQVPPNFEVCRPTLTALLVNVKAPHESARSSSEAPSSAEDEDFEPIAQVSRPQGFLPKIPHPDLVCIASDGLHLSIHRVLVAQASSVISAKLGDANIPLSPVHETRPHAKKKSKIGYSTSFTPPRISVKEESTVLATLFELCYPDHILPTTPPACLDALAAANRLGMPRIVTELKAHWRTLARQDPLRAYFAAARIGHSTCAEEAAKCVVQTRLDGQHIWEMETSPVLPYHLLTTYYDQCRAAAKVLLRGACASSANAPSSPRGPTVLDVPSEVASSTEVEQRAESEVWLQKYLDDLFTTVDEHPGQMPPGAPEALFEQASVSGHWCRSCEGFVQRLSSVAQALRNIPSAVGMVKFEWA